MQTNRNKLAAKYNRLIEEAKEAFLERTGKKIARGFKETKEYKDLSRRKKRALYRQQYRKRKKAFPKQAPDIPETPPPNMAIYAQMEPHHLVLSYGGSHTRLIEQAFKDQERAGRTVWLGGYVEGKLIGTAADKKAVTSLFSKLYAKGDEVQAAEPDNSLIPVNATGEYYASDNTFRIVVNVNP